MAVVLEWMNGLAAEILNAGGSYFFIRTPFNCSEYRNANRRVLYKLHTPALGFFGAHSLIA